MNKQSNAYNTQGFYKQKNHIKGNGPILVQEVKVDTTAIWIKNRASDKVIHINKNSSQHN